MKQGKILIVDDNEDILFTLKMLLRPLAEKVTTLSDPCAMLPLLSRVRHDVILLDMNFRDDAVSGREVCLARRDSETGSAGIRGFYYGI